MAIYRPKFKDPATGEKRESTVWWMDFRIAGRRVKESTGTTRRTLALQAEKNRKLQIERALCGLTSEDNRERIATVKDKVGEYMAHYGLNHRKSSVTYSKQRLAHVVRLLGGVMVCDMTEARVKEYMQRRVEEGASGRTINMEVGEASRALGVKWSAVWPRLRKMEENHDVGRALSPEEERRLLEYAAADDSPNRNPMLFTFLQIALTTAMRAGEILELTWAQVDFERGILTVGRKAKTRASSQRQIPMNRDLRSVLELHAAWYAERMGELRPEWFVFPGKSGRPTAGQPRPWNPARRLGEIRSAWDRLREATGIQCRLHDLRHTAATKLAESGAPESTMLALMGHTSRVMLEHYSHVRLAAKREAVAALSLPKLGGGELARGERNSNGVPQEVPQVETLPSIQ